MARRRTLWLTLGVACLVVSIGSVTAWRLLDRKVESLSSPEAHRQKTTRELDFRPLAKSSVPVEMVGDGSIHSIAFEGDNLWTGGGDGLLSDTARIGPNDGLTSLRVTTIAAWRGALVFALESGGWGRLIPDGPEEASSGFGRLEVRGVAVSPANDLYLAAAQGLFRVAPGGNEIEKIDSGSFRAVIVLPGGDLLAGGESGLSLVQPGLSESKPIATPDPWIESISLDGKNLWVGTAGGIAAGRLDGPDTRLSPHPKAFEFRSGALWRGRFVAPASQGEPFLVALSADGSSSEIPAPEPFPRLFSSGGQLFGDGSSGLQVRQEDGSWRLLRKRSEWSLPLPHVNALAVRESDVWAGLFDGPVVRLEGLASVKNLPSRDPWGVNALLSAGGAVYAATLRGAYRLTGGPVEKISPGGAAFSLAESPEGVIVGLGEGVLFPGPRLLSAFHGLPGNQAYALATGARPGTIWVGTPSGLGRIENRKVTFRAGRGEGKLPHPWVTALLEADDGLWIATYGGGVTRLSEAGSGQVWTAFPETGGLKVNAGALVRTPAGDVIFGTQGRGLWGLQSGSQSFQQLRIPLPSANVFSLALHPASSPVTLLAGTSEGLARIPLPALFKP